MKMSRVWEMPNSKTFRIKAIQSLIIEYADKVCKDKNSIILDPFANENSIGEYLRKYKYITNDLDTSYNTDYHLEAQDFMAQFEVNSVDLILYDPPYSSRQVSECYKKLGKTVTMTDTDASYFVKFKDEIARVLKPNGVCISFGWNTNGIGKKNNRNTKKVGCRNL